MRTGSGRSPWIGNGGSRSWQEIHVAGFIEVLEQPRARHTPETASAPHARLRLQLRHRPHTRQKRRQRPARHPRARARVRNHRGRAPGLHRRFASRRRRGHRSRCAGAISRFDLRRRSRAGVQRGCDSAAPRSAEPHGGSKGAGIHACGAIPESPAIARRLRRWRRYSRHA